MSRITNEILLRQMAFCTQNFFLSHSRDKTKNIFLYFLTELKIYISLISPTIIIVIMIDLKIIIIIFIIIIIIIFIMIIIMIIIMNIIIIIIMIIILGAKEWE